MNNHFERAIAMAQEHPPVILFSNLKSDVAMFEGMPGWRAIDGTSDGHELLGAVEAFNRGELAGLAMTFGVGSMGIRLASAKKILFAGTASPNVMAQAAHRAPEAEVVLL